jgi:hypothetical protein
MVKSRDVSNKKETVPVESQPRTTGTPATAERNIRDASNKRQTIPVESKPRTIGTSTAGKQATPGTPATTGKQCQLHQGREELWGRQQ